MRRAAAVIALACAAQLSASEPQQPVFRAGVDVVRIDVSVMSGVNPVGGLTIDNFTVADSGVPQKIESVSLDKVPLSLMLVLDVSGSMAGERLMRLKEAASGLVHSLRADDSVALLRFAEEVRLPVPMTRDRPVMLAAIDALEPGGATSLNDAIFFGLQLRPADVGDSRPVVLVFSDGRDTLSFLSDAQVLEATRRSGMILHVVELTERGFTASQSPFLGDLANAGGGRRWHAASPGDLRTLFGRVLDELRARYLLTYYPSGVPREGWHNVKVSVKGARGDVTARPGYYVPPK